MGQILHNIIRSSHWLQFTFLCSCLGKPSVQFWWNRPRTWSYILYHSNSCTTTNIVCILVHYIQVPRPSTWSNGIKKMTWACESWNISVAHTSVHWRLLSSKQSKQFKPTIAILFQVYVRLSPEI